MQPKLLSPFKSKDSASPVMGGSEPIAAIEARYRDEWLAIEVTATNRRGDATTGIVIAHDKDHDKAVEVLMQSPAKDVMFIYSGNIPIGADGVLLHVHISL